MSAPIKNQNAAKPAQDRATSFLYARVKKSDKRAWFRVARKAGGLSAWVIATLNAASKKDGGAGA